MNTWRYTQNGQRLGPVGEEELKALLKSGVLSRDTPVSKEGTDYWAPANLFPELMEGATASTTPPPLGSGIPPLTSPPSIQPGAAISETEDISHNKIFAVLAYIGLLFLVPLLAAPQSRFARYHTNQGIVLFLAHIIGIAAAGISFLIPFVGCIGMLAMVAVNVGFVVLMVMGIVNAASGVYKPLPLIGHYKILE
ncbi:GYF domain-containing protein [Pedosphaera parvula]|uniref:GYF domain-containing protein n=1 Tax=Pedosphaera parvula (strain Ellin514) TaxID=320771 RepID=B9XEX1_PEDPL|nr:GYF domain-containing protein [Pedosphaera parvula]EEF61469.1 hypothetical protein Cflav_PD4147 [Pedosphaera parvula Ellin514]